MTWSGAVRRLFNTESSEVHLSRADWEREIETSAHPELKSAVEKLLRGAILHAELRYRVKQRGGCYVEVLDRMFPFPNPDGPPRKLIGSLYLIDSTQTNFLIKLL